MLNKTDQRVKFHSIQNMFRQLEFVLAFAGKASYKKKKKLIAFLPHYFIVLTLYFYDLFLKLIFEKGERKRDRERGGGGERERPSSQQTASY